MSKQGIKTGLVAKKERPESRGPSAVEDKGWGFGEQRLALAKHQQRRLEELQFVATAAKKVWGNGMGRGKKYSRETDQFGEYRQNKSKRR